MPKEAHINDGFKVVSVSKDGRKAQIIARLGQQKTKIRTLHVVRHLMGWRWHNLIFVGKGD